VEDLGLTDSIIREVFEGEDELMIWGLNVPDWVLDVRSDEGKKCRLTGFVTSPTGSQGTVAVGKAYNRISWWARRQASSNRVPSEGSDLREQNK
jgi:hypothetical protein